MSQSPADVSRKATREDLDEDYVLSVVRLNQMLDRGVSWSGHELNCCFLNMGAASESDRVRFANVSAVTGFDFADDGRGAAIVDWDFDGDLDVWTSNRTAPRLRFMRNDLPAGANFLALHLTGTTCNRDAVGARVELVMPGKESLQQIRTVRAGDAFLSQSSKWIHFGLGDNGAIDHVVVRWPDGATDRLTALEANAHYHITQGTGQAERWTPPATASLVPQAAEVPAQTAVGRALLTSSLPLPSLLYQQADGVEVALSDLAGTPVLVNLWGSWCAPCVAELREWTSHADEIQAAGLRIVALSVDGLAEDEQADANNARAFLERINFPFDGGMATPDFTARLEVIINYVYGPDRPLPIPTSILVDAEGNLAAVYKGASSVAQILSDVAALKMSESDRLKAALPVEGTWLGKPSPWRVVAAATELANAGHDAAAIDYLVDQRARVAGDPLLEDFVPHLTARLLAHDDQTAALRFLEQMVDAVPESATVRLQLGELLLNRNDPTAAEPHLRAALQRDNENAQGHFQLGNLLSRRRDLRTAATHYQRAVTLDADHADAHYQLGAVLFQLGDRDTAIDHFKRVVQLRPDDGNTHVNLGGILASQGRLQEAAVHLREGVQIQPDNGQAHNNLGRLLIELGRDAEAVEHLQQALVDERSAIQAAVNLARLLATSEDSAVRNPERAIEIAEQATRATNQERADVLFSLAHSYAAAGQFDRAVRAGEKALEQAQSANQGPLAEQIERRLRDFRRRSGN